MSNSNLTEQIYNKMEHIAGEIISGLDKFTRNEQAFSLDFYISATESLTLAEELLDYLRLYLPDRPDLVKMIEQERNQLFEWAHIANGKNANDLETRIAIAEAKGHTKGFAERLAKKIQHIVEIAREELMLPKEPMETHYRQSKIGFLQELTREEPTETEQNIKSPKEPKTENKNEK